MRAPARLAAVVLGALVMMAASLSVVGARAESTGPVTAEAWFWRRGGAPAAVPSADPAGHLPVAALNGAAEKVALLRLAGAAELAPGTKLSIAAPGDDPGGDVNAGAAALRACLVLEAWTPVTAGAWDELPRVDCDIGGLGEWTGAGPDRRAELDLSQLTSAWQAGAADHGLALVPEIPPDAADTWQVALHGRSLDGVATVEPDRPPPPSPGPSPLERPAVEAPVPPVLTVAAPPPARVLGTDPVPAQVVAPPAPTAIGSLPIDRDREAAALWGIAALAAALAAWVVLRPGERGRSRRAQGELRLAAASAVVFALVPLAAWSGAAHQPVAWAQVPYLVSGTLTALVVGGAAAAVFVAGVLDGLPRDHPIRSRVRASARRRANSKGG